MQAHGDYGARPPQHGPSLVLVVFLSILFGAIAGFGGTLLAFWGVQHGKIPLTASATTPSAGVVPVVQTQGAAKSFTEVANQMDESVVNINTLAHQANPFDIFGYGSREVTGLGTGIIISADGYIMTNFHVVGGAESIKVTVMHRGGKREYPAKFIGGDKQEDLALIKINAAGLQPVAFGDSDRLQPGEPVMAIGNPFGFEHTVSVGVVSALNRRLPVDDAVTLKGMIQTDASINPGNSGGPLVNQYAQVVGINTAIFRGQGGGEPEARGIGFSIPSNRVVRIMKLLRSGGKVQHPFIGIGYSLINDEIRKSQHLPVRDGLVVTKVYRNGPADKGGLGIGDIITAVDRKPIRDEHTLSDYVSQQSVGKVMAVDILRWDNQKSDWGKKTVRVRLENMPTDFQNAMNTPSDQGDGEQSQPVPENGGGQVFPFPFPF